MRNHIIMICLAALLAIVVSGSRAVAQYNVYRANLHVHSSVSGYDHSSLPSPDEIANIADGWGLDVVGFSEHANSSSHLAERWDDYLSLGGQTTDTTDLRGFECGWHGMNDSVHFNIFGSTSYIDTESPLMTLSQFYDWVHSAATAESSHGCIVGQFNHPWFGDHFNNFWRPSDADTTSLDDTMALIEIGCAPGVAYKGPEDGEQYLNQALSRGWHVAPTIGEDDSSLFLPTGGIFSTVFYDTRVRHTGILAGSSSRYEIMNALRARRVFASEDANFELKFEATITGGANWHWMGQVLSVAPGEGITFGISATDPDANEQIDSIKVMSVDGHELDPVNVGGLNGFTHMLIIPSTDLPLIDKTDKGEWCFYVRVLESDGDYVYSAPIWVQDSTPVTIQGRVTDSSLTPLLNAALDFGTQGTIATDANGDYVKQVRNGWGGYVTARLAGYKDGTRYIPSVSSNLTGQNFTLMPQSYSFAGTNTPGQTTDFSFDVGTDVSNLSLAVTNTAQTWSHLLLKKYAPPTDQNYDFISQFDGRSNSINLEQPELSNGTWYFQVRTPSASASHAFTVQMTPNVTGIRSATYPVSKPQAFQSSGSLAAGQWHYYRVEIPAASPGWRLVLNSSGTGIPSMYVRKDNLPTTGSYLKAVTGTTNGTVILTASEATAGSYYVGIYQPSSASTYQLYSEIGSWIPLEWDPGTTHLGTKVFTNASGTGGYYYFKITTQSTTVGAWRTALNVLSGEANLYIKQGSLPTTSSYTFKSDRVGSDGFVLSTSQFSPAQDWYILVSATPGSQWNLVTGEAYVQNLGVMAADDTSSSGPVIMGAEGMRFFKTTTTPEALAWRLWLNGANNTIYVKKSTVPFSTSYDLSQAAQMLVVPTYLDGNGVTYFVSVIDNPGVSINLDSRRQEIIDLPFNGSTSLCLSGYGYQTYRVQVPVEQIAWQTTVSPTLGNPNVAIRRNVVPNERENDAYSEVSGSAEDSVTLVPPTLSDGTFYITVYGTGPYDFSLVSGEPPITDIAFSSLTTNDRPALVGWRYYRVVDILAQLGCLGWQLSLTNQVPGTEIALRKNFVPGRWQYRQGGTSYNNTGHVDYSGIGYLNRPGHQADIWYIGVYMPSAMLGSFTLSALPIPATPVPFDGGSSSVAGQAYATYRYFRVDVPAGGLGWDLRLTNVTSGSPSMTVCRDYLPGSPTGSVSYGNSTWPSNYQWAAGYDWTGRYYDATGTVGETGRILAMGMGNPLEPGTYYVGVKLP